MYIGIPASIPSVDTSVAWNEKGQKLLVHGTVYKLDGKTPALNVILYYWHTDSPRTRMKNQNAMGIFAAG